MSDLFPGNECKQPATEAELRHSLSEFVSNVIATRGNKEYLKMLEFISRFTHYSAFNYCLLYTQNPNVTFVASQRHWQRRFKRELKENARPLLILMPKGPIGFVYDLSDTTGKPIPDYLEHPFKTGGKFTEESWERAVGKCMGQMTWFNEDEYSQLKGGQAKRLIPPSSFVSDDKKYPLHFQITLNSALSPQDKFPILIHEMAHIFCGHLGSLNDLSIPARGRLPSRQEEFEAESVSYLVCKRMGLETSAEKYLAGYLEEGNVIPDFNFDIVIKSVGRLEILLNHTQAGTVEIGN